MDLRLQHYYRANYIPAFIAERTPSENREDLLEEYVYFFRKNFEEELENLDKENFTVAIDTANGATSVVADKVFTKLGITRGS